MRGVGGPLLCIGDLLSDVGEESGAASDHHETQPSSSPSTEISDSNQSVDLTRLFQENYDTLNEALAGSDHSWTGLTLKLCTALETANKLVQSTNVNARLLSEKVGVLEKIVKSGDSAVAAARTLHVSLNQKVGPCNAS
ncbi:uncharacterized protein LOC110813031 [Carica papaya]|uniref:uncharacterized protein LOC110813031 n=1 Tax=Carica papaya TaxID=3649 RepID=UPI000B8CDCBF|nr:uncharacterized protein LOC110813031 [Carica papaya]XP_021895713.1 uncharacterized protein LOC110813031 [Carica papaya]XP_021895714.1 uncharacterized protein LOC110813031 [Carica papaya]